MYMIIIGTKAQQHICQVQSITDNLDLQIRMITYNNIPMYKQNKGSTFCTGVYFMVRSGFHEYEEEKLSSPAFSRQENATFLPHIHGTRSAPISASL